MVYKSLAKKAGRRRAKSEREADPDPLSGSGVLVDSGHSQDSHSAALVDLKFLARVDVVVVVAAVVVVGAVVVVVAAVVVGAEVVVGAAVVVVGTSASVVVVAAAVVVSASVGALPVAVESPPSVAVVAAGVVPSDVVAAGVVPSCVVASVVVADGVVAQQSRACSAVQVGRAVVAGTVDVDAASREATQAAKRTTATLIFWLRTFSLSVLSLSLCMQRLWVLSVSCLFIGSCLSERMRVTCSHGQSRVDSQLSGHTVTFHNSWSLWVDIIQMKKNVLLCKSS